MEGEEKMKYIYPGVFTLEEDGKYSIIFPDFEGCYTCGDNLEDGIKMAVDVLSMVLRQYKKSGKDIPKHSSPKDMRAYSNVYWITVDTDSD